MSEAEDQGFPKTTYLVQRAQKGDRDALQDLFERYAPRVYRIVALRLGRRARDFGDLEDVAQDALLNLFEKLDCFEKRSEASFRNWVSTCVSSSICDHVRHATAQKRGSGTVRRFTECKIDSLADLILPAKGPRPSEIAQAGEIDPRIEDAILNLPKHYREIIILRHLCEMSHKEIGETLGLTESAARQGCARATTKLKKALSA